MGKILTIKTESGRWLAWPENRLDILASGETKREAKANLKKMYAAVMEYEKTACA